MSDDGWRVTQTGPDRWHASVWDPSAVRDDRTCPDDAWAGRTFGDESQALAWCRWYGPRFRVHRRARAAWDAGIEATDPAWLPYFRAFMADEAVTEARPATAHEAADLWIEVYDRGYA